MIPAIYLVGVLVVTYSLLRIEQQIEQRDQKLKEKILAEDK